MAVLADSLPTTVVGKWAPPFSLPILGIHTALLPTGKVMLFSYPNGDKSGNTTQAWLWDPATGTTKRVDPPLWTDPEDGELKPANIWCAGQALLADGRLLVAGGNLAYSQNRTYPYDFKGLNKVYTFNPFNETWTEQPEMRHGRWYPTTTLLPNGSALILDGLDETGDNGNNLNPDVEVFNPSSNLDAQGTTSLIGTMGGPGEAPSPGGLYPHVFSMPAGRVLVNDSVMQQTFHLRTVGNPPTSYTWDDVPDLIKVPRTHHNTVLLPDGTMVTIGGGTGSVGSNMYGANPEHKAVELWSPATGMWMLGPSQVESRAYHSTAILLPDGRVLSAGDDFNGGTSQDTGEIYSPPYLFRGPRPTISSALSSVTFGQTFTVVTPNGSNIVRAVMIAPGATTHANDMHQRYIPLPVTPKLNGVDVTAPPTPQSSPPGYYMLFLVN